MLQPASVGSVVEPPPPPLPEAPALPPWPPDWPGLLEQAPNPARRAMPTIEQPEQRNCLRIAAPLFRCKSDYQKSAGRAAIIGTYPSSPAARGAEEDGFAFNYWMLML